MLQRIKKLLERSALFIAILATLTIAFLSLSHIPKISFGIKIKSGDKYLHFMAYFFLSLIWYFAFQKKLKNSRFKLLLISVLVIYGIVLEVLQGGLTNYRTADVYDALANTLGILLASLIVDKFLRWYHTI